jgi:hypothetical protein
MWRCSCLCVIVWCLFAGCVCGVWGLSRVLGAVRFLRRKRLVLMPKVGRRVFLVGVRR